MSRPNEDNRQSHKITRWPRRFPRRPSTAGCRPFWKTGIMWSGRREPQTLSERLRSIWIRLVFLIVLFLNEMAADGSTQRLLQQTHYKKNFMYNLEIPDNNPLIIRSNSLEMFYVEHIFVLYSDYMWQAQVFLWNRILKNVWRHKTSRKLYTQIWYDSSDWIPRLITVFIHCVFSKCLLNMSRGLNWVRNRGWNILKYRLKLIFCW